MIWASVTLASAILVITWFLWFLFSKYWWRFIATSRLMPKCKFAIIRNKKKISQNDVITIKKVYLISPWFRNHSRHMKTKTIKARDHFISLFQKVNLRSNRWYLSLAQSRYSRDILFWKVIKTNRTKYSFITALKNPKYRK